jgi:hypothetical protein
MVRLVTIPKDGPPAPLIALNNSGFYVAEAVMIVKLAKMISTLNKLSTPRPNNFVNLPCPPPAVQPYIPTPGSSPQAATKVSLVY